MEFDLCRVYIRISLDNTFDLKINGYFLDASILRIRVQHLLLNKNYVSSELKMLFET